jgi:hypothetical protein
VSARWKRLEVSVNSGILLYLLEGIDFKKGRVERLDVRGT